MEKNKLKTLCVIPCSGYGTRMNLLPNQSKEMLIDKTGFPVIQYSLDLCDKYDLEPLIITRKEKVDLIDYIKDKNIETLIIEPEGEWPNTILKSQHLWNENNILILPDTRFEPTSIINDIKLGLELGNRSVIAVHDVEDVSKWCIVGDDYRLIEKPKYSGQGVAMGLIGFKNIEGKALFDTLCVRGREFQLLDAGFVKLNSFEDITRDGVIK